MAGRAAALSIRFSLPTVSAKEFADLAFNVVAGFTGRFAYSRIGSVDRRISLVHAHSGTIANRYNRWEAIGLFAVDHLEAIEAAPDIDLSLIHI